MVLLMYFFRGSPRLRYSFCWRFVHNRCALTQRPARADEAAAALLSRAAADDRPPRMTLLAFPPDHSVTSEGNVSSRKRRVANLVPLRQQSPMALLYAKVVERCSHPCSPLASDPPARPFSAQTGKLPYSRTVVNKVGFVDHYPINNSSRTLQYHILPKISIARCPKRSTFLSDNSRV